MRVSQANCLVLMSDGVGRVREYEASGQASVLFARIVLRARNASLSWVIPNLQFPLAILIFLSAY